MASAADSGARANSSRTASTGRPRPSAMAFSSWSWRSATSSVVASWLAGDGNERVNGSPKALYAPAASKSGVTPRRWSAAPKNVSSTPIPTRPSSPVGSANTRSQTEAIATSALPGLSRYA